MQSSVGQLELALLRAHLHTFERQFYTAVGRPYVKLDEARALAAKAKARFMAATNKDAIAASLQVIKTAEECAKALSRPEVELEAMKRLHRELARNFHPDLASDNARREVREKLMIEVNAAWHDQDMVRLELLASARDTDENGDAARQLAALAASPSNQLRERYEYANRHETDLLQQLSDYVLRAMEQIVIAGANAKLAHEDFPNLLARAASDLSALRMWRELQFPEGRSLGELSHRAPRDIEAPQTIAGPAQGTLTVPFNRSLILRIAGNSRDLRPLAKLDPGDLQGFINEWPKFITLNDDEVQPLGRFPGLEVIVLGQTEITGRVFDAFPTLHELRILSVDETAFDDNGLMRLEECVWMEKLDVSFTQVTGTGVRAIRNMTALRELNLYGTDTHDDDLFVLDQIPGLRTLNLGLTSVTDACASHIGHLRSLEAINLGGTGVTDLILDTLIQLPSLQEVVLWETWITEEGLARIADNFPNLQYLDVDQTKVSDEAQQAFRPARPEVRTPSDIWADQP